MKIPCGPKLTAKQHTEQERKVAQLQRTSGSSCSRSSEIEYLRHLSTVGTNLSQYSLLQQRQDAVAAHLRAMEPFTRRMNLQGNSSVLGAAEKHEKIQEGGGQGTAEYTSYPTPE